METRKLSDEVSVAGQVRPEDMEKIATAGFRSVVCNRPDGEAQDQPDWTVVEQAAEEHGLETRFIPVGEGYPLEAQAESFAIALDELPKPVLAYCRTGTRSGHLYDASRAFSQ